jgi:hypothetical protein
MNESLVLLGEMNDFRGAIWSESWHLMWKVLPLIQNEISNEKFK